MSPSANGLRRNRAVAALGLAGGILLTVIGLRYFVAPQSAARTFGVPGHPSGLELHYIIGLRNVWLGLLAAALALLREWRALALWVTGAVAVCLADALIVATSTGRIAQMAFHLGCGIASAALAVWCWRAARARRHRAAPEAGPGTGDFAALGAARKAF
jgi:Domain of unknown function (DUF4267)